MIGCKAYFNVGGGWLGRGAATMAASGVLLMVSIVNRAVARGSGEGLRYGSNILSLFFHYTQKLLQKATMPQSLGILELTSIAVLLWGLVLVGRSMLRIKGDDDIAATK